MTKLTCVLFLIVFVTVNIASKTSKPQYPIKAVAFFNGTKVKGTITFTQAKKKSDVTIIGEIKVLTPGDHGFHVHQYGVLSTECLSTGTHYNPLNSPHGGQTDDKKNRHVGDLGNIVANSKGIATVNLVDKIIKLNDYTFNVIGRGLVIHQFKDDLGNGGNAQSLLTGNCGPQMAGCATIAHASL